MIAGRGTPDQAPARLFAYRNPDIFAALIERLVGGSIAYLSRQIEAGADCIQIFDSWAGALGAGRNLNAGALDPVRRIIAALRSRYPQTKIIAFPRGAGLALPGYAAQTGADALGLDTSVDPATAAACTPANIVLQGNLDPLALIAGGESLREAVARIQSAFRGRPHIFNLGHGHFAGDAIGQCCGIVCAAAAGGMSGPILSLDQSPARHRHHRLYGGHALSAAAFRLSRGGGERASQQAETFKVMERRLEVAIMRPALILVYATGITLAVKGAFFTAGWLNWKLLLVVAMTGIYIYLVALRFRFAGDRNVHSGKILSDFE